MKLTSYLALSTLVFGGSAFAHSYDSSIVVGPNFSSHAFDAGSVASAGSPSTGVGYHVGSFIGFDFSEMLGLEFGVLFSKRTTSFPANLNLNTTALNLPLLFRVAPFENLRGLKFEVGPYLGLLTTGSTTQNGVTVPGSVTADSTDFGFVGGLSYFAPVNEKVMFRVSAFYNYGLLDVVNDRGTEVRNRGIDTFLGIVLLY